VRRVNSRSNDARWPSVLSSDAMPRLSADVATGRSVDADFASADEVIIYEDEGDAVDAKSGLVEQLTEEKLGLLTETEQVV